MPFTQIPINRENYLRNFRQRYDSVVDGLQNEAFQNSLDAWDQDEELVVELFFDENQGSLTIKDNAGGMTKKKLEEKWLALEEGDKDIKDTESSGHAGQGTAIFMLTGHRTLVETQHNGTRTHGIYLEEHEGERHVVDVNPPDIDSEELGDTDGTFIKIDLKEEIYDELRSVKRIVELVQKWWHIALQSDNITFKYGTSSQGWTEIEPVDMPEPRLTKNNIPVEDGPDVDTLRIFVFEDERPSTFNRLLGITCDRQMKRWMTPPNIKEGDRLVAIAESEGLATYEKTNHRGFRKPVDETGNPAKNTERAIKRTIRQWADEEFSEEEDATSIDNEVSDSVEEAINDAAEMISESEAFDYSFKGGSNGKGPGEEEDKDDLEIDSLSLGQQEFDQGEKIDISLSIRNNLHQKLPVSIAIKIKEKGRDDEEALIKLEDNDVTLDKKTTKTLAFGANAPEKDGRYTVKAVVTENASKPRYDTRSIGFRVNVEPIPRENPPPPSGSGIDLGYQMKGRDKDPEDRERWSWKPATGESDQDQFTINSIHPGLERMFFGTDREDDQELMEQYAVRCFIDAMREMELQQLAEDGDLDIDERQQRASDIIRESDKILAKMETKNWGE